MLNQLLDKLLPPKLWAVCGQLQFTSMLLFIFIGIVSNHTFSLLLIFWMIAGCGIFPAYFRRIEQ